MPGTSWDLWGGGQATGNILMSGSTEAVKEKPSLGSISNLSASCEDAPSDRPQEQHRAKAEVYGFVCWIATGLIFGTTLLGPLKKRISIAVDQKCPHVLLLISGIFAVGIFAWRMVELAWCHLLSFQVCTPPPTFTFHRCSEPLNAPLYRYWASAFPAWVCFSWVFFQFLFYWAVNWATNTPLDSRHTITGQLNAGIKDLLQSNALCCCADEQSVHLDAKTLHALSQKGDIPPLSDLPIDTVNDMLYRLHANWSIQSIIASLSVYTLSVPCWCLYKRTQFSSFDGQIFMSVNQQQIQFLETNSWKGLHVKLFKVSLPHQRQPLHGFWPIFRSRFSLWRHQHLALPWIKPMDCRNYLPKWCVKFSHTLRSHGSFWVLGECAGHGVK